MKKILDKTAHAVVYSKSLKPVISPSNRVLDGKRLVTIITPRSVFQFIWFFTHPRRWFRLVVFELPAGIVMALEFKEKYERN